MGIIKKVLLCICILLCLQACTQAVNYNDSKATELKQEIHEVMIPKSLLQFAGETQTEFVQSFNKEEDSEIYSDVKIVNGEVFLYLTEAQRNNFLKKIKANINTLLKDFFNLNSDYKIDINSDYTSIDYYYDEKLSKPIEAKAVGGVIVESGFYYILNKYDSNWSINLKIYNCHTGKIVSEGTVPYDNMEWTPDDWEKSYE